MLFHTTTFFVSPHLLLQKLPAKTDSPFVFGGLFFTMVLVVLGGAYQYILLKLFFFGGLFFTMVLVCLVRTIKLFSLPWY